MHSRLRRSARNAEACIYYVEDGDGGGAASGGGGGGNTRPQRAAPRRGRQVSTKARARKREPRLWTAAAGLSQRKARERRAQQHGQRREPLEHGLRSGRGRGRRGSAARKERIVVRRAGGEEAAPHAPCRCAETAARPRPRSRPRQQQPPQQQQCRRAPRSGTRPDAGEVRSARSRS